MRFMVEDQGDISRVWRPESKLHIGAEALKTGILYHDLNLSK
jgi:hypothetical protein